MCWEKVRQSSWAVCVLTLTSLLSACSSELVLASWACRAPSSAELPDASSIDAGVYFEYPWSTSFENGFCDFQEGGYCYTTGAASYKIVESPVRSGHYAAAFTVIAESDKGTNSRCFRQGALPQEAYYGAWYYIPTLATNSGNWNLFHFRGPSPDGGGTQGWDLSLVNNNNNNGGLRLSVRGYLSNLIVPDMSGAPAIPIGSWFHIVMYLKRAADATGEVSVYQDNNRILDATKLITDNSIFDQWYVGNLADSLNPPEYTLYVDDVTIEPTL
jgi:hypothetical protein